MGNRKLEVVEALTRMDRSVWRIAWSYARGREEAEDLAQDIRLKVLESSASFGGRSIPGTWIYRVALNVAADYARRAARRRHAPLDDEAKAPDFDADGRIDLRAALESLAPRQRQALLLREMEGLSYKEIAAAMRLTVGGVESSLFDARKRLSRLLKGEPGGRR